MRAVPALRNFLYPLERPTTPPTFADGFAVPFARRRSRGAFSSPGTEVSVPRVWWDPGARALSSFPRPIAAFHAHHEHETRTHPCLKIDTPTRAEAPLQGRARGTRAGRFPAASRDAGRP